MADNSTAVESSRRRREAAARYIPDEVRLLLVAHAPSASLERCFYFERLTAGDGRRSADRSYS